MNLFFSPEFIFFFVAIKVLPIFINHFHVKGVSSNLSSRTCVRDKYIFSQLIQGESYGFEAWSQGKSYRNLQKVRESISKKISQPCNSFMSSQSFNQLNQPTIQTVL